MDHHTYGVAAWSSAEWRAEALAWIDERLAAAGRARTGDAEQTRIRPWSTLLRAPATGGTVWFKAAGPATAFEAGLVPLLARVAPGDVLTPVAADPERGWLLLPDGGASLGERLEGDERDAAMADALTRYGRLQRALCPCVDELLALGVADMRPAAMPARFGEAVRAVAEVAERAHRPGDLEIAERAAALEGEVAGWCERLAASPLPPSLDHNDLHPWNVLGDGRFFDWGDAVVAHPFAAMLVPLDMGADAGGYLDAFATLAPRAELERTLRLARRVAVIARVLTWERALRSAWEQGETLEDSWTAAPAETLAALLRG